MLPLLAAAAVPAVFQGISAISQKRKANRINAVRPEYTIPGAVAESVDMARQSAGAAMPGYGTARNNIAGATSNAVRAAQLAGSGNNVLATIAAAQGNEANAMNNLAAQNAQFQFGQRRDLMSNLLNLGNYQDKAWQLNKYEPYQQKAAAKAALTEAANQNMNGAISGLSSVAMMGLGGMGKPKMPTIPGFDLQQGLIPTPNPYGTYNGYQMG